MAVEVEVEWLTKFLNGYIVIAVAEATTITVHTECLPTYNIQVRSTPFTILITADGRMSVALPESTTTAVEVGYVVDTLKPFSF